MRKTNFRKATLSALLMLVVAVVSLTGVTYAWFTSGETADVNDIEFTVDGTAGGLSISKGDFVFGSSVSFKKDGEVKYAPVSTTASALLKQELFTAKVGSTSRHIEEIVKADAKNYLKEEIYIDNTGNDTQYVKLNGTVTATKKADSAVRVAIVIEGFDDTPEYGAKDTFEIEGYQKQVVIYDANIEQHTNAGINEVKGDLTNKSVNTSVSTEVPFTYAGIKAQKPTGEILKYLVTEDNQDEWADKLGLAEDETVATNGDVLEIVAVEDLGANTKEIKIQANALVKATIYVWIEGQDHDCHNDITGANIQAGLQFTIVDAPAQAHAE